MEKTRNVEYLRDEYVARRPNGDMRTLYIDDYIDRGQAGELIEDLKKWEEAGTISGTGATFTYSDTTSGWVTAPPSTFMGLSAEEITMLQHKVEKLEQEVDDLKNNYKETITTIVEAYEEKLNELRTDSTPERGSTPDEIPF